MSILSDEKRSQIKEYSKSHDHLETISYATVICDNGDNEAGLRLVDLLFHKVKYPLTDLGNAERLNDLYGDSIHWVTERQRFIFWTGHAWTYDTPDHTHIMKLAKNTVRKILENEKSDLTDEEYKDLVRFALSSESQKRLKAMVDLVKSEGDITISVNDLNKDNYLFNCKNATVDLRTGKARLQSKDDLITVTAPVDFDPAARAPLWDAFLLEVQQKSEAKIKYLQKLAGWWLTGDTRYQIVPLFHGEGENGKSTYLKVIRVKVMGDYADEIEPEAFLIKMNNSRDSGIREQIANLYGKRLVTCTEIAEGRQLTVNLLKAITGGESISGDRKYEHTVRFTPTFKVILSGNNEPVIKENSHAVWRRLKKIGWLFRITKRIEAYEDTFNPELPGILNWMIEGWRLCQVEGLNEPEDIVKATEEYRKGQDILNDFLEDKCELKPEKRISKKSLKAAYLEWCKENNCDPVGTTTFKARLTAHGVQESHTEKERIWVGISLKPCTPVQECTANPANFPHEGELEKVCQSEGTDTYSGTVERPCGDENKGCNQCSDWQLIDGQYQCARAAQ